MLTVFLSILCAAGLLLLSAYLICKGIFWTVFVSIAVISLLIALEREGTPFGTLIIVAFFLIPVWIGAIIIDKDMRDESRADTLETDTETEAFNATD